MDFHSNLEFLCRVCAANTKGKNSVAECVYILKTPGLRDKLDKFLYLKIFENDALPKVLCKSCFRQVEATASLSKIAKHTQQVFRDFLFSSLPKGTTTTDTTNSSEYTSSDFLSKKDSEKSQKTSEATIPPAPVASVAQLTSPPPLQTITALNATPRKDEVIVNVSVSDPLTRENQQKVISNSQRRHSIMIEAATAATFTGGSPIHLAQKTGHSSGNNRKSSSPARVLQFCPIAPKPLQQAQASQQPTQVTTFSSGGYVIGPMKPPSNAVVTAETGSGVVSVEKEVPKKSSTPLATTTAVSANDNTILQQKRKNLVKALNNIKANSTGQVSLLKSSQQKQQQSLLQQNQPPPPATKQVVEDELPDRIIIAAPKNKQSSGRARKTEKPVTANSVVLSEPPPPPINAAPAQPPKPNFPEDILLGRVIRDIDLLKLILKALQWPVNKQNMDLQLQRLKTSRFTDIMSDSNLLQDTDLTQLLGPYLAPVLMAAQALQQQQQMILKNAAAAASNPPIAPVAATTNKSLANTFVNSKQAVMDPTAEEINKAIPYKLPPETSVQLVPALPEELPNPTASSVTSLKRTLSKELKSSGASTNKRQRKSTVQKHRDSIVISDEDEEESSEQQRKPATKQRTSKLVPKFEIDLTNPSFLAQLGLINGSSELANEALLALLQKQKMTMAKQQQNQQRRRHSSMSNSVTLPPTNEFDALINIDDDIVLMEPVTTTTSTAATMPAASPVQKDANNFVMPAQVQHSAPLITRPIIKRRKTVIQSSRMNSKEQAMSTSTTALSAVTAKETTKEERATAVPCQVGSFGSQVPSNAQSVEKQEDHELQSPSKSISTEVLPKTSAACSVASLSSSTETSPSKQGSRKQQNKAALGQQLLEAIGLQKVATNAPAVSLHYVPSSTSSVSTSGPATSKQSVQQIRSALKKSLKQAQEQQQMRNKDISSTVSTTVIQDADSTTKPVIKEIVTEHRSNTTADSSSSHIDVEEQIDKITLVKSQNVPTTTVSTAKAETLLSDKDEAKKEQALKKKAAGRITERRCTLPSSVGRGRLSLNSKVEKEKTLNVAEEVVAPQIDQGEKTKLEKDDTTATDSLNISSSSITSTELAQVKEDVAVTPRRRGRKRVTEAVDANETTSNSEKEKDKDKEKEKEKEMEKEKESEKEKEKENDKDTKQLAEKPKTLDKIKEEQDETSSNSGRPTRQSKTLSKYYKGPDKAATGRRSLPARATRNRKYS